MWLKLFHFIGLTNLSDEQVKLYKRIRVREKQKAPKYSTSVPIFNEESVAMAQKELQEKTIDAIDVRDYIILVSAFFNDEISLLKSTLSSVLRMSRIIAVSLWAIVGILITSLIL